MTIGYIGCDCDKKTRTKWRPLEEQFEKEVHLKADQIDPDGEHHWGTLTIGWAIAKGMKPKEALEFAAHIRYHTNLG